MKRTQALIYGKSWLEDEYLDAADREFIEAALHALDQEPKFIISEQQIISAVKFAIEQSIQEEKIVDILMHDIEDEIETVLYDDCEEYKAESEE